MKQDGSWDDKEVSTKEHDDLVLHLLNKDVAENIVRSISVQKPNTEVFVKDMYSEYVVGKRFIYGYIDVAYNAVRIETIIRIHDGEEKEYKVEVSRRPVYIEVKPRVENFGSLLRQINKYKANITDGFWIVYTKECPENIKTALEGQGIIVMIHK